MQQVQEYIRKIDFKKVTGFIIDEDEPVNNQESNIPLLGLYSAFKELKNLDYEKVLVLPCDIPLVKYEVILYLIEQCKHYDCCIPKWSNNLLEPLLAIYPVKKVYETSLKNLKTSQYKLTKIIDKKWKTNYISIEQEIKKIDPLLLSFENINKREDIRNLELNLVKN